MEKKKPLYLTSIESTQYGVARDFIVSSVERTV